MTIPSRLALLIVLLLSLTVWPSASRAAAAPTPDGPHYTWSGTPSRLWVQRPDGTFLRLRPWTYCWTAPPQGGTQSGECADGSPPDAAGLRRLTSGGSPRLWFGRAGWHFSAHLSSLHTPSDSSCRSRTAVIHQRRHWFRLTRPERPGVYQVDLFGRGPEGDEALTFKWRVGRWDSEAAC
jgi:hypothetical protein